MSNNVVVDNLKKNGFAAGVSNVLTENETQELGEIVKELFASESNVDRKSANCPVIINLLGKNRRLDEFLEKIVSHESVKSVLFEALGHDYKIWQVNARRSEVGDEGLYLHQDAPGETNLAVLLTDNTTGDGATAFLPGSHKLPRWSSRISWSSVRLATPWVKPVLGKAGDIAFFFNRTWHMRFKNNSSQLRDVILISFFPAGATYSPYMQSQAALSNWEGWELKRLLDPSIGTRQLEGERYQVNPQIANGMGDVYAMQLECIGTAGKNGVPLGLCIKIAVLEILFRPMRLIYRLVKPLASMAK